jgi:hypothetical protein
MSCEDSQTTSNFHEFWTEELQKNKTLIFDCCNLVDPKEWGVVIYWG